MRAHGCCWTLTPILGGQDTSGMQLDMCQHPTLSYTVPGQVTDKQEKAAQAPSLQADWAKPPVQRLGISSFPPGNFDWEEEEISPFLQERQNSQATPAALLLPGRLREMFSAYRQVNAQGARPSSVAPDLRHMHSQRITWYTGDLTNLVSMCQPSVWYMCSWYSASQRCQTCVRVLYSTQTLISPWDLPGRTSGILQLKTHSEYKIIWTWRRSRRSQSMLEQWRFHILSSCWKCATRTYVQRLRLPSRETEVVSAFESSIAYQQSSHAYLPCVGRLFVLL